MKVFILSAGLGKRMMPLTQNRPKPLLEAAGVPLLTRLLRQLSQCGFDDFIVNTSVFASQFEQLIGDGRSMGIRVCYSHEGDEPLNTADGIRAALHLLGDRPFVLVNADIHSHIDYARLKLNFDRLAHLVLTPNPAHNPDGDFGIGPDDRLVAMHPPDDHPGNKPPQARVGVRSYTYCGVAVVSPALLLESFSLEFAGLRDVLAVACNYDLISAEIFEGHWVDVGTPARLRQLDQWLSERENEPGGGEVSSRQP